MDVMTAPTERIQHEHGLVQARAETEWVKATGYHTHSGSQAHRSAWWASHDWYRGRLMEWPHLDTSLQIEELRKGEASIYYPLFHEEPVVWADCPNHGLITVNETGVCDQCRFDFTEN